MSLAGRILISQTLQCQAEEMLKEAETKAAARLELKQRNTNADKLRPTGDDLRKLDGSVKKNSGFVKKLVRKRLSTMLYMYIVHFM